MANLPLNKKDSSWWAPALEIFFKFSSWIIFPVISAVFIGQWLDKKFSTDPWLFLLTVGLAFFISMAGLIVEASKEYKKTGSTPEKEYLNRKNNTKL